MEKLLIVTRDFTPYCARVGWMIRAVSLANFFSRKGYEVAIVGTKRCRKLAEIPLEKNIALHWVKNSLEHFDDDTRSPQYLLMKVLQRLYSLIYKLQGRPLIDNTEPALPTYRKKIFSLLRKSDYQQILISTPPHSLLLLIPEIKKHYPHVSVIADLRDAWSLRPLYLGDGNKKRRVQGLEKEALEKADHVLFVSQGMKDLYCSLLDLKSPQLIENGFISGQQEVEPEKDFQECINNFKSNGFIVLGYFGSGHLGIETREKDLSVLFRVLESDEALKRRLAIVLQGNVLVQSRFQSSVAHRIFAPTSNIQSIAHMKLIDVGVNLNADKEYAPIVMGGKIYEYISCGKPLFNIAHSNAISLQSIVRKTDGYFADISDQLSIQNSLRKIIADFDSGAMAEKLKRHEHEVPLYSRDGQYEKLLEIMSKNQKREIA